uniref:Uncharacterized protein n=1 Tax=Setaria digitata TaxID=48799 RepID=A0A915PSZ4_9BILA
MIFIAHLVQMKATNAKNQTIDSKGKIDLNGYGQTSAANLQAFINENRSPSLFTEDTATVTDTGAQIEKRRRRRRRRQALEVYFSENF